jgi:hypothetical protein
MTGNRLVPPAGARRASRRNSALPARLPLNSKARVWGKPQTSETKVRATLACDYSRGSRPPQLAAGRRDHRRGPDEQRAGAGISALPRCGELPSHLPPKASKRGWKSRLTPFLFNNIPALRSHLLCFHIHSSFCPGFPIAVLCFQ